MPGESEAAASFVVACEDDGYLYGCGVDAKAAWQDAEEWMREAVSQMLHDELIGIPSMVCVDISFRVYPCDRAVMESVKERGGHQDWVVANGRVVLKGAES